MIINKGQIAQMEKRFRTTFINSLPGYKCLQLVGTISGDGITNLALFNSIFHVGANPPLLGMVFRPETPNHDTLKNIQATGQYTLNNVLPAWYKQAHMASASYPKETSEFESCNFSKSYLENFKPPFVLQSSIKIGMELRELIELDINQTTLVIGEVVLCTMDGAIVSDDGYVDHLYAGSVTVSGLDSYFTTQALARLSYAKPGQMPAEI